MISTNQNPDGHSYPGPSAAPIKNTAVGEGPGTFHVELKNITHEGFDYQPKTIQTFEDSIKRKGLKRFSKKTNEKSE